MQWIQASKMALYSYPTCQNPSHFTVYTEWTETEINTINAFICIIKRDGQFQTTPIHTKIPRPSYFMPIKSKNVITISEGCLAKVLAVSNHNFCQNQVAWQFPFLKSLVQLHRTSVSFPEFSEDRLVFAEAWLNDQNLQNNTHNVNINYVSSHDDKQQKDVHFPSICYLSHLLQLH